MEFVEDKFSFPVITEPATSAPDNDQFEFGSHAPTSPNSPADHLFYNGKLLPHVFPAQACSNNSLCYSRSASSSRDESSSFMSSRSNSTNSTRSTSARTSTSEWDRKKPPNRVRKDGCYKPVLSKTCQQSSSQGRWQLIMAAPVMNHQGSGSGKAREVTNGKGLKKSEVRGSGERCWPVKKLLRAFVSACNRCHAIDEASGVVMTTVEI